MYYINATPNPTGNYGNPMGQPFEGCVNLPDDLLTNYIKAKGFVNITKIDETKTIQNIETNVQALENYNSTHPDITNDVTITQEDRIKALEFAMLNLMEVNNDV